MTRNAKVCPVENENLKPFKSLSRIQLRMALTSYNNFEKYLQGDISDFDEYDLNAMRTLYLLQCLGFSVKELGTHLYKDIVMDVFTKFYFANEGKFEDMFQNNLVNAEELIDDEFTSSRLDSYKTYVLKAEQSYSELYMDPEMQKTIYGDAVKPEMNSTLIKKLVVNLAKSSYLDRKNKKGFVRFKENN